MSAPSVTVLSTDMDMMQTFDPASFNAFARLMARPDPTDLPRRAHVRRCEGDPSRRATRLPAILMRWAAAASS